MRWWCSIGFVANFIRFPTVKVFGNRLRFDKVTESLMAGTFLRHSVVIVYVLDLSKAFDKVNHHALLTKVIFSN